MNEEIKHLETKYAMDEMFSEETEFTKEINDGEKGK